MGREVNRAGLELIKEFEGFSAQAYADVVGKRTIGFGHLLRAGENWQHITKAQAEQLLQQDLQEAQRAVGRLISAPLSDNAFSALVSFAFNLGGGALQRSTLRQKINRGEVEDVAREWRRWVWAGGRRWPGLLRRRDAEIMLYFQ